MSRVTPTRLFLTFTDFLFFIQDLDENATENLFHEFFQNLRETGQQWDPENHTIQKDEVFFRTWCRILRSAKTGDPIMVKNASGYLLLGFGSQFIKWEGKTDIFRIITREEDPVAWEAFVIIMTESKRKCEEGGLEESLISDIPEDNILYDRIKGNLAGHGYRNLGKLVGKRHFAHREKFNADTPYDEGVIGRVLEFAKLKNQKANARKKKARAAKAKAEKAKAEKAKAEKAKAEKAKAEKAKAEKSLTQKGVNSNISASTSTHSNSNSGLKIKAATIAERPASVQVTECRNGRGEENSRSRKRSFVDVFANAMHFLQASPQDKRECMQLLLDQGTVLIETSDEPTGGNEPPNDQQRCPIPPRHPNETRSNVSEPEEITSVIQASGQQVWHNYQPATGIYSGHGEVYQPGAHAGTNPVENVAPFFVNTISEIALSSNDGVSNRAVDNGPTEQNSLAHQVCSGTEVSVDNSTGAAPNTNDGVSYMVENSSLLHNEVPRTIQLPHLEVTRSNVSDHDETTNRSCVNDVSHPVEYSTAVRNNEGHDGTAGSSSDNFSGETAPAANVVSSDIVNSDGPDEEDKYSFLDDSVKSSIPRNEMSLDQQLYSLWSPSK